MSDFLHITFDETVMLIDNDKKIIDIVTSTKIDANYLGILLNRIKSIEGINFLEVASYEFDFTKTDLKEEEK